MRVNYKEIIRLIELDAAFSARYIAKITNISRPIVNKTINCVRELGLTYETVCKLSDKELTKIIKDFKKTTIVNNDSFNWIIPDYKYVHEELKRKGVTLSLLWTEYCVNNKDDARQKYQYSSFCSLYKKYTNDNDVVMHIDKKPGYSLEVDWAGTKILYYNKNTNICSKASVFIAVLPYSNFTYAEAFPAETTDFWIAGHINAFLYINGTPLVLIPDNLKTGVNKADRYDPVINKSYANMAEYYNIAIIPTRVVKPRDKATVEKAVKDITTWIIAALRNQKFFSINDINLSIKLKLNEYNKKNLIIVK
jgi:transposase